MRDFETFLRGIHAMTEGETKPPALIVEALRDQAQFFARQNPFNFGDIVTPRKGTDVKGAGEANIVIAVEQVPEFQFVGEPASNVFGQLRDLRVLHWVNGTYIAHWVESAKFEHWVDPAEKSTELAPGATVVAPEGQAVSQSEVA